MAHLYLIPNLLGEVPWQAVLPCTTPGIVRTLRHFIVEDIRNARRFLKKLEPALDIDSLTFFTMNHNTSEEERQRLQTFFDQDADAGLISEAGCPAVADPGAEVVLFAHRRNYRIIPLVGPSSLLLALMASGLNGQNFSFSGYLPVKREARIHKIRQLESLAVRERQSQLFIETPYRNNLLLRDLLEVCHPATLLCIAANLTTENEQIKTMTIGEWKEKVPDLDRKASIFILGAGR